VTPHTATTPNNTVRQGRRLELATSGEPPVTVVHGPASDEREGRGQLGQLVDVDGERVGRVGEDVGEASDVDGVSPADLPGRAARRQPCAAGWLPGREPEPFGLE
jgi:hypothetical protein